jgi:thymidylate synthase (FAD)
MKKEVLDHGYVELVEAWGSDERIIESARMSTAKAFQGWGERHEVSCPATRPAIPGSPFGGDCNCAPRAGDEKLLKYLWDNKHATPFEMGGLTIEVQAPIFVFREWHRHRTQSYSELSARYTPMPDVNYLPSLDRVLLNAGGSNKQAGTIVGAAALTPEAAEGWLLEVDKLYHEAQRIYSQGLELGVPKELARLVVPVARYSRMRASANLRNWLQFLSLRLPASAQWEIRQFAEAVGEVVAEKFPRTWELFKGSVQP